MGISLGFTLHPATEFVSAAANVGTVAKKEYKNLDVSMFADFQVSTGVPFGTFSVTEMSFFSGVLLCFTVNDIIYAKSIKNNIDTAILYIGQGIDIVRLFEHSKDNDDIKIVCENKDVVEKSKRVFQSSGITVDEFLKNKLG